jgi:hypothetical protein
MATGKDNGRPLKNCQKVLIVKAGCTYTALYNTVSYNTQLYKSASLGRLVDFLDQLLHERCRLMHVGHGILDFPS